MSETVTMTLTEFLLARIAEDEGRALYAHTRDDVQPEDWGGWWFGHQQHYERHSPRRVIAECEAKRRIVRGEGLYGGHSSDDALYHEVVLCFLALPYAEHPEFREEWRP